VDSHAAEPGCAWDFAALRSSASFCCVYARPSCPEGGYTTYCICMKQSNALEMLDKH
jgi:hypothetical protein